MNRYEVTLRPAVSDDADAQAFALYERTGWVITATSPPTSRWFDEYRVHRMVKRIDPSRR